MIAYLPEIYPDELVYSWFCRYYVHTGCITHKAALQEILYDRCNNPSKEFLGHLNPDMIEAIQRMYPIEDIIINHTMYPQYARFIPLEQKKKALHHMAYDFCDAHHLFAILPRSESDRYMKYCPICAAEDRRQFGEAYWHRLHQLRNMQVCTKHNCKLVDSSVIAMSNQTFTLCPAESHITTTDAKAETNPLIIAFSQYMADVFNAPMDFENDIPASAILYAGMQNTKYLKATGRTRYTKQLAEDMQVYYSNLDLGSVASMSQIQRVLLGVDRFDFSVICQIAFYLSMDISALTKSTLTAEEVEREQRTHYMTNRPPMDWAAYDEETAPLLEEVARAIYDGTASETGRPERVSEKIIYREMGFPGHRLENLPLCKAIFDKYTESYEENWARRIVWAYGKLKQGGKPFYWSDIRLISGVKKKNIAKVIPLICKYTNKKTTDAIIHLVGGT